MNNQEMIEQSMLAQQVYLDIVRRRHLAWANAASDPDLKRGHLVIAELIEQTNGTYYDLLNAYYDAVTNLVPQVRS